MKERGIVFSGPMVRALLDGSKTQARQVVTPGKGQRWLTAETIDKVRRFAPSKDNWWTMAAGPERRIVHCGHDMDGGHIGSIRCPHGAPGDRLWVRETWDRFPEGNILYRASGAHGEDSSPFEHWRPSIHMPRWASRITLELAAVRVERLQEISEADAVAEGGVRYEDERVSGWRHDTSSDWVSVDARYSFRRLWDSLNAKRAQWASNPFVWVLEFRRVSP